MAVVGMREFWDQKAREDAFFFVDDRRRYGEKQLDGFWAEGERDVERLLDLLGARVEPTDVVLDIGCGVGRLTRALAHRAAKVYGIDVSGEMLERARRHNSELDNVEWLLGDGTTLRPVGDGSLDVCFSHVVFQHIPDPRVTLGYVIEMGRVLKPGGWSAFQISNDPGIHRPRKDLAGWRRRLTAAVGRAPHGQGDPAWLGSAVDLADLRSTAHSAGLDVERIVGEGTQFCLVLLRRRAAG